MIGAILLHALIVLMGIYSFFSILYFFRQIFFSFTAQGRSRKSPYQNLTLNRFCPTVTVVVPAHNEEKTIEKCLTSILNFDYPDSRLQVVVINDRSTDSTLSAIQSLQKKHKNLILHQRAPDAQPGKPAAIKEIMPTISSEIVVFFDADYHPGKGLLKKLLIPFLDARVGATMGRVIPHNTNRNLLTRIIDLERRAGYAIDQQGRSSWKLMPQFGGTVGGIRMKALNQAGGWNAQSLTEDTDLSYRLLLNGWNIEYLNHATCYEESPETWQARFRQLKRWSYGHNECMLRYFMPLLKEKNIPFWKKMDALLVLTSFFYGALTFLCIPLCILFHAAYEQSLFFLFYIPLFTHITGLAYFGLYWQIIMASIHDKQTHVLSWVPFLPFSSALNGWAIFSGFFQLMRDKIRRRSFEWEKTPRYTTWST